MRVGIASMDWAKTILDANGHPVWGGAGWVRMGQYVKRSRHDVTAGTLIWKNGRFGVLTWDMEKTFDYDVLIMQRNMFEDVAGKIKRVRANGQLVVNDIDDWFWGLDPSNGAWKGSHPTLNPEENIRHYAKVLSVSTAVTVSTPYLRDRLSQFVHAPMEIIENYVDVSRFTPRVHADCTPTIGWAGSTSHRSKDLETLKGVLSPFANMGTIKLHHSGDSKGAQPFWEAVGVRPEQVSTTPLVPPTEYPDSLHFDIGLAPLRDAPFNRAKSWIKAIEYAAAGIPFIASDLDEYRRLQEQFGIGRLAKRSKHWLPHVKALLDPVTRQEEADRNRQAVMGLDISQGVKVWDDFLEALK